MSILFSVLQFLSGLLLSLSYFPKIFKLVEVKTAENESVVFWYVMVTALSCSTVAGLLLWIKQGTIALFLSQFLNLFFAAMVLGLLIHYRHKEQGIWFDGEGIKQSLKSLTKRG